MATLVNRLPQGAIRLTSDRLEIEASSAELAKVLARMQCYSHTKQVEDKAAAALGRDMVLVQRLAPIPADRLRLLYVLSEKEPVAISGRADWFSLDFDCAAEIQPEST